MDKKDEIISRQMEIIRQMTEKNLRSVGGDLWGARPGEGILDAGNGNIVNPVGKSGQDAPEPETEKKPDAEKEKIEDLEAELDSYIGLSAVKDEVKSLINTARVYKMRTDNGLPTVDMSLHLVFSGNPGTGKTMIARFMARVYHSLGILSKGQLTEVDRSGLVAGFVGQTAIKTAKVLESAKGGVLFIDEAYTLTSKADNDFGYEAVDTVLKFMEDNRGDIVVIVAGYTELMRQFIDSNPGLQSRFNRYLDFEDYTDTEMLDIFALNCKKSCYETDESALGVLKEYFAAVCSEEGGAGEAGNARGVRNLFERSLTAQANRLSKLSSVTKEDLMRITAEDIKEAAYGKDKSAQ